MDYYVWSMPEPILKNRHTVVNFQKKVALQTTYHKSLNLQAMFNDHNMSTSKIANTSIYVHCTVTY